MKNPDQPLTLTMTAREFADVWVAAQLGVVYIEPRDQERTRAAVAALLDEIRSAERARV